ncbi:hypothetical protein JST97_19715 [bacterium]|nr:hypothetical protein [bacterium]
MPEFAWFLRALQPSDAKAVVALADQAYPGTFYLSVEDVKENLSPPHLCIGLFAPTGLLAYLMCWRDTSQVEEYGDEPVLLLDDIVVRDGRHLILLLRALRQGILAAGWENLAMEGTHRPRAEALFRDHPRVIAALGYRQVATHHYFGEREGEQLCWARYEPTGKSDSSGEIQSQ